jgi:steroid delta-isomerase-like uncharacterized protein
MSTEENKALVCRVFDAYNAGWSTGNWAAVEALIAPDYVNHDPGTPIHGRDGLLAMLNLYRSAYSDASQTIEDLVAEGDKVVALVRATGTHTGELMGIPPTGKVTSVSILTLMRIQDGQLVEEWERFDLLNLLQQLGVAPATAAVAAP